MIDLTQLKVNQKLGEGSQGKVFLATDPEGGRFTVKLVVLDDRIDRRLIFDRAAHFRADLIDPSMVPILSYGMLSATPPDLARQLGKLSNDALVLVMPFVTGVTLAEVEAQGVLTLQEGVAALAGMATALARLPKEVGHGDLRAPNVFIRPSGEVALLDPDLSSNPDPANDVRALAAIALNLAKIAVPTDNGPAIERLKALVDEIAGPGLAPTAAGAAQELGEIAILLGAPAANVTSVLAKLVIVALGSPGQPMDAATAVRGRRRRSIGGAIAVVVLLLAAAALISSYRLRPERVTRIQGGGDGLATTSSDSLYDTTGTVHYTEPIHPLGPNEKVAGNDGLVQIDFESSIARIAILSPRKDVLWEMRAPPVGGSAYLDARPGHYYVEQDRDLGGGRNQQDQKLFEIDLEHPLRVTTTKAIVNSPRPPEK